MFEAVYMAATGLTNQQRRLDVIGDNIANTNTIGFKTARLDFEDALYTAGIDPGPAYTPGGNLQKGHGVMTAAITSEFNTGSLLATGNMLDFAIEGDAFFQVVDPYGNLLYTKAGNFYASMAAGGMALVNSEGNLVKDAYGNNLIVPDDTTDISVSSEGMIIFKTGDEVLGTNQFGLYEFPNKLGLVKAGGSSYTQTGASGEARLTGESRVSQYMLESSNVDMAAEMTRLLRTQRAFSLAARALTTADDMEGIANRMRNG